MDIHYELDLSKVTTMLKDQFFSCHAIVSLALLFVLKIALCVALDVRIDDNTAIGVTLFRAGLPGTHWVYRLDVVRNPAWTTQVLRIDSGTGAVTLARKVSPCDPRIHYAHTITMIYLDSFHTLDHSTIRLPVNIHYVSPVKCKTLRENKLVRTHRLNIGISVISKITNDICIEPNSKVLGVNNYIPVSLSDDCSVYFKFKMSEQFTWNEFDQGIYSKESFSCVQQVTTIAKGSVQFVCKETVTTLPVKIILKSEQIFSPFIWQTVQSYSLSRYRRQSTGFNPPTFSQHVYVFNIPEEQPAGVQLGFATISDADQRQVKYTITANRNSRSQDMFEIDATTGELRTTTVLDREYIANHQFQLMATDLADIFLSATANLNIFVTDINDHSPEFELETYRTDVLEGHSSRTTILTVRAIDEDAGVNANIEYSIVNHSDNDGKFEIDPRLGIIRPTSALDREEDGFYTIQIRATDMASSLNDRRRGTANVEITVLDANDNKPQFSQASYTFEVSENIDTSYRHVIGEIRATDNDEGMNALITYSITGGNTLDVFEIDPVSGQLLAVRPLDYEQTSDYRLQIKAQDSGSPPKSNSTQVLVRVVDMNDNDPYFSGDVQIESIHENVPIGYTIAGKYKFLICIFIMYYL